MRNVIKQNKKGWFYRMEQSAAQYEVQRYIDRLDQIAIEYESRWGMCVLERLCSPDMAVKWQKQKDKLNNAIQNASVREVAELVEGSIRGYKALEKDVMDLGHEPTVKDFIYATHPESGRKYAIAVNSIHARQKAGQDVVVYTLEEIVKILESRELVNVIKERFENSKVVKVEPFDFKKGDDVGI